MHDQFAKKVAKSMTLWQLTNTRLNMVNILIIY